MTKTFAVTVWQVSTNPDSKGGMKHDATALTLNDDGTLEVKIEGATAKYAGNEWASVNIVRVPGHSVFEDGAHE